MDPLSITATSISIAKLCITVCWEIKQYIDAVKSAASVITVLRQDVESFQTTLENINEILENPRIKASVQSSGHVGTHWASLRASLDHAKVTMHGLVATIVSINKTVGVLDSTRRHMRLQSALPTIQRYQQQVQIYKDTINVSLQTAILFVLTEHMN